MGRNAGKQRDKRTRALHAAEVARRAVHLHQSQRDIADALGLSQQSVSIHLRTLITEWQRQVGEGLWWVMAQELARLALVEEEYWRGWEASKQDLVTVTLHEGSTVTTSTKSGETTIPTNRLPRMRPGSPGRGRRADIATDRPQRRPSTDMLEPSPGSRRVPATTTTAAVAGQPPGVAQAQGQSAVQQQVQNRAAVRSVSVRSGGHGDIRWLKGVQQCIEARSRLYGLNDAGRTAGMRRARRQRGSQLRTSIEIEAAVGDPWVLAIADVSAGIGRAVLQMEPSDQEAFTAGVDDLRRTVRELNLLLAKVEGA